MEEIGRKLNHKTNKDEKKKITKILILLSFY